MVIFLHCTILLHVLHMDTHHSLTSLPLYPKTNPLDTYAEALLLDLEHLMATLDQMAHKHSSFKISELLTHGKLLNIKYILEKNMIQKKCTDHHAITNKLWQIIYV